MRNSAAAEKIIASPRSKPSTRRKQAFLYLALVLQVLLWGCNGTRDEKQPGSINFIIESSPTNLDPRIGTDAQSEQLDGLIFDSLLSRDAQMNVVPDLAESWDQPDAVTYIFHL